MINEIALEYIKDKWSQYLNDTSHLEIRDRLENDNAILFYVLDCRYDKDFTRSFFDGTFSFMGFYPPNPYVYYYDKKLNKMREMDGDFNYFSKDEISSFYSPDLNKDKFPKLMNRLGAIKHDSILHMFDIIGINYPLLVRVNRKYDGTYRYLFIKNEDLNNEAGEKFVDEKVASKFVDLLNDWGITYERKNDGILIDRVYKKK